MTKREPRNYLNRTLVSEHELKLFIQVVKTKEWWTCAEMSQASGLRRRIVATHLMRWLNFELVERVKITPEHRWKLSPKAETTVHYNKLKATALTLGWLK